MNYHMWLQRFFAGAITVTFFATNTLAPTPIAHALPAGMQAQNVESPAFLSSFTVPVEFGKVTDRIKGSENGPLLIHIQEAHANYDAQKNIKNILEHLSTNYGVRLVLLEGAGNKLTPGLFNFFPQEPGLQHAMNEKLLQAGELAGAEVFLIDHENRDSSFGTRDSEKTENLIESRRTSPESRGEAVEAWGIENAEAYAENREAFKRVFEGHELARDFLEIFHRQWQTYASLLMSKPLKEFLTRETAFEEGRLPLADWLVSLKMAAARDLRLDLDNVLEQKDWPALVRYFRLKAVDPKIDAVKVETEKKAFLEEIVKLEGGKRMAEGTKNKTPSLILHPLSVVKEVTDIFEQARKNDLPAYKTRFVFERLLDQLPEDFSFDPYPNLRLHIQQIVLLSELKSDALQDEIKNLTAKLTTHLIKTEQDRQFAGILHDFRLVKKLFKLELNRGEYQAILSGKITLEKLLQGLKTADPGQRTTDKSPITGSGPQSLYGKAICFYEGAIERENWMMKQSFARMQERKQTKAVLITGGFHTEGLKERALRAGSSYIEITPRIGEITADSRKNYLTALLGQKAVETSQIAALMRSDMNFLKEVFPKNWRRELAKLGANLRGKLREVVSPERAHAVISNFLATAAGASANVAQPVLVTARSETRAETRDFEIKDVIHVAYEMAPFFEVGGVKDVMRELVPAFKRAHEGVNVSVILPAHKSIWNSGLPIEKVRSFEIHTSFGNVKFTIFKSQLENVTVYFIENPYYFQEGYDETNADTFWEATTFSRAAVEAMEALGLHPDIVHAHDAQTALVIPFMRFVKDRQFFDTATIYTIHNLGVAYQLRYPMREKRRQLLALGIPAKELDPMGGLEFDGQVNPAKAGIVFSDWITTVSKNFRDQTLTPEGGFELQDVLRVRSGNYVGIMNALDVDHWNPAEPFGIYKSYSADDLDPKRANKESFLSRRGFEMDLAAPLIVAVSRIREQKGMDWVLGASRRILRSRDEGGLGALLSVVGAGDAYLENEFSRLETEAPGRFKFLPIMGRNIVLETLSAADIGLVPSRFEPAGIIQQQMQRYGTIPVVRATGGLVSTVEDPDEFPGQGTGFRFGYLEGLTHADINRVDLSADLYLATARAANLYSYDPEGFTAMQKRTMKSVRSWDEVVPEYMEVYRRALANRFAFTGRSEVRGDEEITDDAHQSGVRKEQKPFQGTATMVSGMSGIVGASAAVVDHYAKAGQDHGVRSELRMATPDANGLTWAQAFKPRMAKEHFYSRQWECGLPMDLLEKIAKQYSSFEAGEISQATLTGGLGALMPDLFEAWAAIGMNVTGIHPLWNFIKNAPGKGYDQEGRRKFLAEVIKQFLEKTDIEFETTQLVRGAPKTVFFRVYKTYTPVHKSPQYYLDAYTKLTDGKEEPFFQEVYDDHGKREEDMAFFAEASERLIRKLENDPNPDITLIDHEVFASLPARHLKRAKRVTFNHTVFRPGLFEAWEGYYDLLAFSEQLRSTIVHDGKISIADFTAENFDLISGVNLVEHLPALLKNIFRTAWHRVKGYYDREKQIRSTNGVFLPRWQSPARRVLIERHKEELQIPMPAYKLPAEADDRQFFAELDKDQNLELRERYKDQDQWVVAGDVAELLIWLREKRSFTGEYDWLGNTFKAYQEKHSMSPDQLVAHLREMQKFLLKAAEENRPGDWAELQARFGEAYELLLADPIAANVRRFVPYKGPDKYEEGLKQSVALAAEEAAEFLRLTRETEAKLKETFEESIVQAGLKVEFSGKFLRPYDQLFLFWKAYKDGMDLNQERYQKEFEGLRGRLKGQPAVEELRNTLSRLLVGGRTFDASEAHDRLRYIRFMTELLGLEDRIATLEDHTYYEAQIIFRGSQAGVMLSDEDLEASATSQMKVKCNGGEVAGPFAGSNPEVWTIRDPKNKKIIEVLNEKGEPNTAVITHDILREKLRTGEWELLDGVFVAYNDAEKSAQEGGGRRPSARSLFEALKTVKNLRSDPVTRRQRSYQAVSTSWKVDILSQVMAQASLLEDMLKEREEREAMFKQLQFQASDYAMPMAASDFGWRTQHPFKRHSAKGLGLFGMFRSFRNLKTWQRRTQAKPDGDPSTRGMEALDSLKDHAYYGDIFKYLRKNVLDRLSPGLQPFKEKIEGLAAQAEGADDREMLVLNLQAMDLTEKLLVRMAGDWFERYMQAGPEASALLRREITQGVREDYQPWAEYIARYLEGHPNARALRTRESKIRSFTFTSAGSKRAVMVNLNVGAPVHREKDEYFEGLKARTQVPIDDKTFRQLTGNAPNVKYIQLREPKLKLSFRVRPKEELASEVGIGIPMPSGIEVIQWVVIKWHHLLPGIKEKVEQQEPLAIPRAMELIHEMGLTQNLLGIAKQDPSAMNSLKQLIRETRTGYKAPEGLDPSDHFFEQLEVLADLDRDVAVKFFGENLKAPMGLIGFFRPDLLTTSKISAWDQAFHEKISRAITEMQTAFGEAPGKGTQHNYYVFNSSHQSALVLARKDAQGNAFFITIQFAADDRDAASDGKISTQISSGDLTRSIDQGAHYQVKDLLTGEDYGERDDLLQGWVIRTPFVDNGDRVQFLRLEKKTSEARSETRVVETAEKTQTKLPRDVRYQDQVQITEPMTFLEMFDRFAEIVRGSAEDQKLVLLRGVSPSSDEDGLFKDLGFAPIQSRQKVERQTLDRIVATIKGDDKIRFSRQGSKLMVIAGGNTWNLRLANGKYSKPFENFIGNILKDGDARALGIQSFITEIGKGTVVLYDPVEVAYGLGDPEALAKEMGLDLEQVINVVITQEAYDRLPPAKPAEKAVVEPKRAEFSKETKALLEIWDRIQKAWTERETHWAVQRVDQETEALTAWDSLFKNENTLFRQIEQAAGRRAKDIAAAFEINGPQKQKLKAIDKEKPFDETPYRSILGLEMSLRKRLAEEQVETDAKRLRARIRRTFTDIVRLQDRIRNRALSLSRFPDLGNAQHPEIQDFFAKDIVQLHFLQSASTAIFHGTDQELAEFAAKLLKQQSKITVVEVPGPEPSSDALVDRGPILTPLSDLETLIKERKAFYDARAPALVNTVSRMYGDVLRQIQALFDVEDPSEFIPQLRQMLDILVTIEASEERGVWSTRIGHSTETNGAMKARFLQIMERIMVPLFMNTPEEVRAYAFGEENSPASRSEMRMASAIVVLTSPGTITSVDQLIKKNMRLGGGNLQGFRGVTEKIMDGIWSLTAHTFNAVELAASFFFPQAQARETFDIASVPATPNEQKRFADARKILLGGKILGASDVLILTPEFGVDLGAALLMRKVAGDAPVAVLIRNETDRRFLDKINVELRAANRPLIFPAATLAEARKFFGKTVRGGMNVKPMVYSGEQNAQAGLLLQQYGDAVITITPRMYQSFLSLAGVSEVITRLRDEYLATARSA